MKPITMKPQLKLESIGPIQVRNSCFWDNKNTISFVLGVILYLACTFLRVVGVIGILRNCVMNENLYNLGLVQSIATLLTGLLGTIVAVDKLNIWLLGTFAFAVGMLSGVIFCQEDFFVHFTLALITIQALAFVSSLTLGYVMYGHLFQPSTLNPLWVDTCPPTLKFPFTYFTTPLTIQAL